MTKYIRTMAAENPAALATSAELAASLSDQDVDLEPLTVTLSESTERALAHWALCREEYLRTGERRDEFGAASEAVAFLLFLDVNTRATK